MWNVTPILYLLIFNSWKDWFIDSKFGTHINMAFFRVQKNSEVILKFYTNTIYSKTLNTIFISHIIIFRREIL